MFDSNTTLYGVFGNPVAHSLSPVMHNKAFSHAGHNGVYLAFQVEDIKGAIDAVRTMGIKGVSITIPHKIAVMGCLDRLDATAEKIGAVNTVLNENGILTGYNSDGLGALRALSEQTTIQDSEVIIIGAGGAARAIGFAVISAGGRVTILNRSVERGESLANDLGAEFCPLSEVKHLSGRILINTTPVGMTPDTDAVPIRTELIEKEMVIMDIIYNPIKTRLLKSAEAAGCTTIDGVAMFVYQGAFQFELWTGLKAPLTIMRQTVMDALSS